MSEQIEKIDITFKDLEAHDVRVLANAEKMYMCIWAMRDCYKDMITCAEELAHVDGIIKDHQLSDLFDC